MCSPCDLLYLRFVIIFNIMFSFLFQPIPDSLSTLSEFMTRMEQALAQNGDDQNGIIS